MPYVDFDRMTSAQRREAIRLRPRWLPREFSRMAFWIKPDGLVSRRNGHHQLTDRAQDEINKSLAAHNPETRNATEGWTGSPPFHVDRSP